MEITKDLFENIVIVGKSLGGESIFDEIEAQEEKMAENGDLYDVFQKINKVLEAPSRYNEIQSVAPAIDVNRGMIVINGVCKHDVKAQAEDLNQSDDVHNEQQFTDNIIGTFANDLAAIVPDNLKVDYEISDDTLPRMDKRLFTVYVTRKG